MKDKYGIGAHDIIAFDKKSARSFDANGFLHVELSPISKETINDYFGNEIPGWRKLGLEPERIYKGYRPGEELEKAAPTFNGLNILSEHVKDDAADPAKEFIIGSMGTDAVYRAPYLCNSLIIKDADAIALLGPADPDTAPKREVSASYRYTPVFEPGVFNNTRYDFIMRDIRGNHIALVEEGRAGSDVVVSDENEIKKRGSKMGNPLQIIEDLVKSLKGAGVVPHEGAEAEVPALDGDAGGGGQDPEAAQDDALGVALEELFMLADAVQDEELAAKLKAVGEAIRQSGEAPAEDEDPEGGVKLPEEEAQTAMDKKTKTATWKKSGATINLSVPLANDAAIAARVEARIAEKVTASRDVRPFVGDVDPLAFDSAADIYKAALKTVGVETKINDVASLRQMVQLAQSAKPREAYPVVSALANDSKGDADPNFARLGKIRKS